MKSTTTSFLSFCFGLLLLSFLSNNLSAQVKVDSSKLYYDAIWHQNKDVSVDSAILFFEKLNKEHLKKGDSIIKAIYQLRTISEGYLKKEDIFESETALIKGLELLDKMQVDSIVKSEKTKFYIGLGRIYRRIRDYESSINYFDRALHLAENSKDSISALNNLGTIYLDSEKYKEAVSYFSSVYEKVIHLRDYDYKWTIIDNLGYAESKLNIPGALDKMELALKMKLNGQNLEKKFSSYRHLTYYYIDRDNKDMASTYMLKTLEIADSLNLPTFEYEALRLKMLLSEDIKTNKFTKLGDSILKARLDDQKKYAAKKYAFDKQEKIAKENELKYVKEKSKLLIAFVVIAFIILLSIFLYQIQKSKHKKDKIKQAYLKEVELSKKVHDELANDMSDLMNYVENDIETSNDKKTLLLDNLEDIYVRTRDISTETASIDFTNFTESLSNLLLQHNKAGTKVVINDINTINWNKVSDYKKMIIYRCLQELMVNMKKHSQAKLVSIFFKEQNNKKEIRYVDDGIGFSVEGTKLNGLENVESRIKSIQGTFTFITSKENGFKAILKFNS